MKIIIEKKQRRTPYRGSQHIPSYRDCYIDSFKTVTYYNVYINETTKENLLGEFNSLEAATVVTV